MKKQLLFVSNCGTWSWGIVVRDLIEKLRSKFNIKEYYAPMNAVIKNETLEDNDVVITQNVDHIKNIDVEQLSKVACRIGGMYIDESSPADRFNEQLSKCGAVIATNEELLKVGQKVNPNSVIIPNGVDLNIFKPHGVRIYDKEFVVGFSGNITGIGLHYKGFKIFGQAVTMLYGEVTTRKLFYRDNQIPHGDMVEKFYHKIQCLVSLSIAEGCSNTIKEALACGVPVIITKVGYHGEKLEHEKNCLFVDRNPISVSDAIRKLKNDRELRRRLCVNGRKFAEEFHDINVVADKYVNVIENVIRRNKNG